MIDFENDKKIFFSIKEVADHFDVNVSLLRYWEEEFKEIRPRKTKGGTRQYTREDIEQISVVYYLVKEKGLTLDGARQVLSTKKDEETRRQEVLRKLENIKKELTDLKDAFGETV